MSKELPSLAEWMRVQMSKKKPKKPKKPKRPKPTKTAYGN